MFLSEIRTRFGIKAFVKVRLWCDINYKMRIDILQRNYLIECRRNVLPRKIFNLNSKFNEFSFHSNFCERKFQNSLNNFKCSLLSLQNQGISNHINFLKNGVFTIRNELEKCLLQNIIIDLLKHQIILNSRFLNNVRGHIKKLNGAILEQSSVQKQNLNLHRVFERKKSDPWFVNLTDIQVPDSVQDILRFGKGFSINMINDKSKQIIEIVKDVEANIHKIPRPNQQDFRNKVLHLSKGMVEKKSLHINSIDRKFANNLKTTKDFLRKNKDLIRMNADKDYQSQIILLKIVGNFKRL